MATVDVIQRPIHVRPVRKHTLPFGHRQSPHSGFHNQQSHVIHKRTRSAQIALLFLVHDDSHISWAFGQEFHVTNRSSTTLKPDNLTTLLGWWLNSPRF